LSIYYCKNLGLLLWYSGGAECCMYGMDWLLRSDPLTKLNF